MEEFHVLKCLMLSLEGWMLLLSLQKTYMETKTKNVISVADQDLDLKRSVDLDPDPGSQNDPPQKMKEFHV